MPDTPMLDARTAPSRVAPDVCATRVQQHARLSRLDSMQLPRPLLLSAIARRVIADSIEKLSFVQGCGASRNAHPPRRPMRIPAAGAVVADFLGIWSPLPQGGEGEKHLRLSAGQFLRFHREVRRLLCCDQSLALQHGLPNLFGNILVIG